MHAQSYSETTMHQAVQVGEIYFLFLQQKIWQPRLKNMNLPGKFYLPAGSCFNDSKPAHFDEN
jgi:hypothetical protein